jgi:L-ascorbate metabolism protein UlaG (beta-lactamase superfamily)
VKGPGAKDSAWKKVRRWIGRVTLVVCALVSAAIAFTLVDGWYAFGTSADGARLARMERSPEWGDGVFVNPQPLYNDWAGMFRLAWSASDHRVPTSSIDVETPALAAPPRTGLRVTWLGHSTLLIEIDGATILTDPVWGARSGPVDWAGPSRWYPPPIALEDLPPIDAVLISHDHYDHLDYPTIVAMREWDAPFIVPLGVGAHLAYWGIPESRIVEVDWWDETNVGALRVVCTPARHASGRTLIDNDSTLWASYALIGAQHRAYFSGDTGLFPALREIGERLGPFDVTMIEAGAYGSAWPDWHLGPEQAVTAHTMVRGRVMLPIHWGLFDLAYHGWTEPMERVLAAAEPAGVTVLAPRPGQSVEPLARPALERWWPDVPWRTGAEDPIRATRMH